MASNAWGLQIYTLKLQIQIKFGFNSFASEWSLRLITF